MTNTSENGNSSCSASTKNKCAPVGLLLFVGFIFGFSIGFASHDAIYKALSKAMYGSKQLVSEPIPPKGPSAPKTEGDPTEEADAPTVEEAKPEEAKPVEAKPEEAKPEGATE